MPNSPRPARRHFRGFDVEREAYARRKVELVATVEDRYVVLVGEAMLGPFESHAEAERAGYARFGLGPLYVKRVEAQERAIEVTRLIAP